MHVLWLFYLPAGDTGVPVPIFISLPYFLHAEAYAAEIDWLNPIPPSSELETLVQIEPVCIWR
jgi:hypothetical protein